MNGRLLARRRHRIALRVEAGFHRRILRRAGNGGAVGRGNCALGTGVAPAPAAVRAARRGRSPTGRRSASPASAARRPAPSRTPQSESGQAKTRSPTRPLRSSIIAYRPAAATLCRQRVAKPYSLAAPVTFLQPLKPAFGLGPDIIRAPCRHRPRGFSPNCRPRARRTPPW